jgi:gamma-glutamyltranspeptidase/glutathione hydrolase
MQRTILASIGCLLAVGFHASTAAAEPVREAVGTRGVVVSGTRAATDAGIRILEQGGNAADAGAATLLALSVTTVGAFCIGGEIPVLIYDAVKKDVKVLAGQGAAPLDPKAIEWYLKNGIPNGEVRAAPVPAALDLIVSLLQRNGTKSFREIAEPTLSILDAGGPSWYIDTSDRQRIETGDNWRAELAVTFRKLVEAEEKAKGSRERRLQAVADRFYRGDIADALERWYIEKGGFLRKRDLAAHRTLVEEPVEVEFHGYRVLKCGPWTQGPYLLQSLRLLEGFDLKKMGFASADYIHVVTESMKLALADRDEYYGDPLFTQVPLKALLSDRYAKIRRPLIDPRKASHEIRPGDPYRMLPLKKPWAPSGAPGGTTVMCVADRWGNVIAATPSGLGSTAGVAGDTGIIHSTRLTSLNSWKGHPNCIEPGKRPRVTLTPTLVLKEGKPVLAIAVAGGDLQDQAALQLILENVEFGMGAEEAMLAPRFATTHHTGSFGQDKPVLGSLQVNDKISEQVRDDLKTRGHLLTVSKGTIGGAAMLSIDADTVTVHGVGPSAGKAN